MADTSGHEHAVRFTADRFIHPDSIVGFFSAHHFPTTPWHDHDFYELGIVASGSGLHSSNSGTVPFARGTVVFVPPGVEHEFRGCQDVLVVNCFFRAELDELELLWASRDTSLGRLFNPTGGFTSRSQRACVIRQLSEEELLELLDAIEPLRSADGGRRRSRARELAHLLLALDVVADAGLPAGSRPESVAPSLVTAARDILERDIAHPWTLAELSARLYVGPSHLARVFGRSMGLPPMHYLARRRAEQAAVILTATDVSVASVGAAVGWSDPSQFSRRFRAVFGVSPRTYRGRHRDPGSMATAARR